MLYIFYAVRAQLGARALIFSGARPVLRAVPAAAVLPPRGGGSGSRRRSFALFRAGRRRARLRVASPRLAVWPPPAPLRLRCQPGEILVSA